MAGSLKDHLTAIYQQRQELSPMVLVDEATPESHPLHHRFEWDNSVAGHKYRLVQASELIRSVKVVYAEDQSGERKVRAFTATRAENEPEKSAYVPTEELLENEFSRRLLLRECEREVKALQRKYGHLVEFADIVAGVAQAS